MEMDYRDQLPQASIIAHDAQKDFSEELWAGVLDQMVAHLQPGGLVLDVGVGSGVVAGRVAERGFDVLGLDFNESMLAALRSRAPRVACAMADAQDLPVSSGSVHALVITNVLHLLEDWHLVVAEAARVLRRGGILFVGLGGGARSEIGGQVDNYFRRLVPTDVSRTFGPRSEEEFVTAAEATGLRPLAAVAESEMRARTIGSMIDRLELNVFTWPPGTTYEVLKEAGRQTRSWVEATFGSQERQVDVEVELRLSVFARA